MNKFIALLLMSSIAVSSFAAEVEHSAEYVAAAIKNPQHPMSELLKTVAPRVVRTEKASGTIVTTNGEGYGILFSALHIFPGGEETSVPTKDKTVTILRYEGFAEAPGEGSSRQLQVSTDAGKQLQSWVTLQPTAEFENHIMSGYDINQIKPETDFFVAAVKGVSTKQELGMRSVVDGERVIAIGYPSENGKVLSFSTGTVESDKKAAARSKKTSGMPFKAGVEKLAKVYASEGFSGGAIFGMDGKFLGVISRGTSANAEREGHVRFVTAKFISAQITAAIKSGEHEGFERFIGPQLASRCKLLFKK